MNRIQRSNRNSDDDDSYLIEGLEVQTKALPVNSALYGQLIFMLILLCGIFILPVLYKNEEKYTTDTFSSVNYLHLIIWIAITILTWYVKAEHKKSRIYGYHQFYDLTRHLHRVAFYMMCGGNVMIIVISCITHNYCMGGGTSPCSQKISLNPVNYIQIIIILEVTLVVPFLIKHIVEVTRFNQRSSLPDVYRDQTSYQQGENSPGGGNRDESYMVRLLAHQADQIMTQNKRNEILKQQIAGLKHLRSMQAQAS